MLLAGREDQPVTYRQLVEGAAVWANTYEQQGVQPGEVVVLILQHGLELIFAYWGAILARRHPLDHALPHRETAARPLPRGLIRTGGHHPAGVHRHLPRV